MGRLLVNLKKLFKEGRIGIYLIAFLIPLNPRMLGLAVAVIIVEQLLHNAKPDKAYIKSQLTWRNPGVWLFLFYIMHFVGLLHTENMGFAKMDLGMKATLGIFPVFFLLYKVEVDWPIFVKAFIIGAFVSIVVNVSLSLGISIEKHYFFYLTGEYLSHLMHRGYWAIYMLLAYFFLLKQMIASESIKSTWLNILGASIMVFFIILSGSKVGFIILIFVSAWAVISMFKRLRRKWTLYIAMSVLAAGILSTLYLTPSIVERLGSAVSAINQPIESFNKEHPESTASRIMVWNSSVELIRENFWWGVGTGDIKDELIKRNYENGYTGVAKKKLNSHNQFFNSHIALGVFGSLFLLLSIITNYLKVSPAEYRGWRIGIITILFFALLPESMLETQAGIIPYAFFITFLPSFIPKQSV